MAPEGDVTGGRELDRIGVIEKRLQDLEALVKGLMDEFLDLKTVSMRLTKASDERTRTEGRAIRSTPVPEPQGQPPRPPTVVLKRGGKGGDTKITETAPQKAAVEPEPERLEMIMQPDGTLKPEKRRSSDYIVASAGYGRNRKMGSGAGSEGRGKSTLIVAEEEEKSSSDQK